MKFELTTVKSRSWTPYSVDQNMGLNLQRLGLQHWPQQGENHWIWSKEVRDPILLTSVEGQGVRPQDKSHIQTGYRRVVRFLFPNPRASHGFTVPFISFFNVDWLHFPLYGYLQYFIYDSHLSDCISNCKNAVTVRLIKCSSKWTQFSTLHFFRPQMTPRVETVQNHIDVPT